MMIGEQTEGEIKVLDGNKTYSNYAKKNSYNRTTIKNLKNIQLTGFLRRSVDYHPKG
jgi:hypothetical protein